MKESNIIGRVVFISFYYKNRNIFSKYFDVYSVQGIRF
jgi:hypothetical protein